MAKNIILTNGMKVLVDDGDYIQINRFTWSYHPEGYAVRIFKESGKKKSMRMHREILSCPIGFEIDHIDGDGLNNQKRSLRIVTHQENVFNRSGNSASTSVFKGVSYRKSNRKWHVQIMKDGKKYHIGFYNTEIEAAKNYDVSAIALFGKYARLNFPRHNYIKTDISSVKASLDTYNKKLPTSQFKGVHFDRHKRKIHFFYQDIR